MDPVRMVHHRNNPVIGRYARWWLRSHCIDLPREVEIGADLTLKHRGAGLVVNPRTVIGDRVTLFHNVTIGRRDATLVPLAESGFVGIAIGDDVVIYAGAVVLGGRGTLHIADGTVVGANAVLMDSTGEGEIWAGAPARCVGRRADLLRSRQPRDCATVAPGAMA